MLPKHIGYLPEIDGLGALAVLGVILFHIDASWLAGGYAGVDVFFCHLRVFNYR
ncbi:hypothetical protein KO507_08325 [Gilvimarinus agarilyticus]|uniref:hypothetical protein n=1 Tax=Gilvimarinus sp. 2_MG-2023 TaxID=3062666 RepID=UPI001C08139B|nr:hypothetical protein [Gilvimarinus sp. 2_MG-2023]MBU2885765.1 hypothetical protein [Gilvimarinus agarilyticus]MDO6570618.1 hypothetical protein [Gilvimarinus sp. 2_MG-2023]